MVGRGEKSLANAGSRIPVPVNMDCTKSVPSTTTKYTYYIYILLLFCYCFGNCGCVTRAVSLLNADTIPTVLNTDKQLFSNFASMGLVPNARMFL